MRAFCTVSAPLEVCASSGEQLSPGSRFLALRLLGNQQPKTLYFLVDAKSRVREVYTQTCLHFATQGMLDTELFGLAVLIDGEYMFADPESKLSKYGPKSWRSSHTHGLDANGRPLLELHFRVQFYIDTPFMLKDETSRHNYYLQLKYNALQRDIPKEYSEQSMILLAGLALQADLGDAPLHQALAAAASSKSATDADAADDGHASFGNAETAVGLTAGAATTTATVTTTLPKISKRTRSANERVLRLSTYVSSTSAGGAATATTSTPATTASTTSAVIPLSSSNSLCLKRSLSPASSISSINCGLAAAGATTSSACAANATVSSSPSDYFRLEDYLPAALRTAWAVSALRACHRENRGMSASDAQLHYIQQACVVHDGINAHTYRMRLAKSETGPGNAWFVVYAKGIKVFGVAETPQEQLTFLWPNITKLSFERKKFEIRSGDSKITLYAASDEKNKMLLTLCKETHQFSMKIAARLKEVIKREEEESNCLHACYSYSRSLHLPYKNKNDQRISVISSTSSNTTSGIVSDRVHSEDELEIMINTPPAPIAAPSTESLALAHLLDRPSVSRQTSSVGQVSMKDLEEQLAALSVRQAQQQQQQQRACSNSNSGGESPAELSLHTTTSVGNSSSSGSNPTSASQRTADASSSTATDSPSSQHNIGSQCSSTCSTVVVASTPDATATTLATLAAHAHSGTRPRRNSTSSSLELGFSHTAQNSTLSEAESTSTSFLPSTRGDDAESVSGVYTLAHGAPPTETSGVYTMHSSEMTGQSSEIAESVKSSAYGMFLPAAKSAISDADDHSDAHATLDSVDGGNYRRGKRMKNEEFRLRSDSNVSTSGSFRGDGSDPTDNKHTLLSAEELTDLIVGRGTYPSRKTVSSTLDSDCDYVTLPLPMEGESYIQGHQDTAPTEDHVDDLMNDLLPTDPPAPPQRIDSNGLSHTNLASLSNLRMRSPPPYNARHEKTGLCGPAVALPAKTASTPQPTASQLPAVPLSNNNSSNNNNAAAIAPKMVAKVVVPKAAAPLPPPPPPSAAAIRRRDPPPYPSSAKPRPTSLVSIASSSTTSSSAAHSHNASNVLSPVGGSMTSLKSEEVTARFITTRPQISILKAHTSLVNDSAKPSYAAPTNCSSAASSVGSVSSHHTSGHHSQHSAHNSNYMSGSQASLSLSHAAAANSSLSAAAVAHAAAAAAAGAGVISSTIGIPIVPYGLHGAHKSTLHHQAAHHQHQHQQQHAHHHHQPPPPPPPYPDLKPAPRTCVLLPVIKPRQFLPPPPPSLPRQPPPPPPPQLAGVYSSQLARKQLEVYHQQLYSDVDYVIYPLQDPAVSQQEYLDAKQGSILAAMAQAPPHPYLAYHHAATAHPGGWDTCKGHAIYRSTPYLPLALSTHSRYASTQNLSDTYVQLPSAYSPLYSPSMASLCSAYEPPPPPPLHPAALAAAAANSSNLFARSRSDDNILNSLDALPGKGRRLPPPPPPPFVNRRLKKPPMPAPTEKPPPIPSKPAPSMSTMPHAASPSSATAHSQSPLRSHLPPRKPPTLSTSRSTSHMTKTSSGAQWAGERPKPADAGLGRGSSSILAQLQASVAAANRQMAARAVAATASGGANAAAAAAAAAAAKELDIALLREKSKYLDLPLISALCNDRSLLKQTKVLDHTKQARNSLGGAPLSLPPASNGAAAINSAIAAATSSPVAAPSYHSASKSLALTPSAGMAATTATTTTTTTTPNGPGGGGGAAAQSPTAANVAASKHAAALAASAAQLGGGKPRKTSISHRHPNDKLPPLPMQLAEANNYVMDPAILKHHKAYNSQT